MLNESDKNLGEISSDTRSSQVLQPFPDTCAIRSQELILQDFGYKTDHQHLIEQAIELGIYEPGRGTSPEDVGKLFDLHGIKYHQTVESNIFDITNELAHGHKIIVGLNSDELSKHGLYDAVDFAETHGADHALIVAGIDFKDPDHVLVNLKDPGTGDVAKSYPLEQFIEAWKDSDCFMVSTNEPPPPHLDLPEMRNFNEKIGHLEKIGELPYQEFSELYEHLNEINFERVSGWNSMCDTFADVVNGTQPVDALDESVHHYIDIYHKAEHATEETLAEFDEPHIHDTEIIDDSFEHELGHHDEEHSPTHEEHSTEHVNHLDSDLHDDDSYDNNDFIPNNLT